MFLVRVFVDVGAVGERKLTLVGATGGWGDESPVVLPSAQQDRMVLHS